MIKENQSLENQELFVAEAVIVEGRDDEAAVARAVNCLTIATHGFGIRKETIALIEKAYKERGIIIFTDPDFSGEKIRTRLSGLFPGAKHAYLTRDEAEKSGDIGIENASPAAIRRALSSCARLEIPKARPVTRQELFELGLTGYGDSMAKREAAGKALGIGGGNANAFLKKLNYFGITREELASCLYQDQKK